MAKYLSEFAEVRKSKDDDSTYIVFTKELEVKAKDYKGNVEEFHFKKGDMIYKNTPQEIVESLVERGVISQDKAEQRIANIPEYILQVLTARQKD